MPKATPSRGDARGRIVEAAARLLQEQGLAAVTTRRVAEEAGVQAPAIYRQFGDKNGLLEVVAEHVMASYVSAKAANMEAASADVDPLEDLRAGWDATIEFGLTNPSVFRLLSDPYRAHRSPAVQSGRQVLESRVHRVALAGHLRVSEQRCVELIQAGGMGTIQVLLAMPTNGRDTRLVDAMYEAVLGQILTVSPQRADNNAVVAAIALRAGVPQLGALSPAERQLLTEWLDRTIEAS